MKSKKFSWTNLVLSLSILSFWIFFTGPALAERFLAGNVLDLTKKSGGEIPYGQTAITSLTPGDDGKVYGATSADRPGKECYLFCSDGTEVEILGTLSPTLPGQQKVWHSLLTGADGSLYGGTWTDAKRARHSLPATCSDTMSKREKLSTWESCPKAKASTR